MWYCCYEQHITFLGMMASSCIPVSGSRLAAVCIAAAVSFQRRVCYAWPVRLHRRRCSLVDATLGLCAHEPQWADDLALRPAPGPYLVLFQA